MNEFWESSAIWLPGVLMMSALAAASGFCSGSETALFYLSRDELRAMQVGRARQRLAARLMQDPDRLLTAILFWNLLINLTFFAVSVVISRRLINGGHSTAAGVFSLGSLAAIIIVGEVSPKSISVLFPRKLAELAAWPLTWMVRVLDPLMPAMAGITRGLRRGLYPRLQREPFLDADDLERALEALPQGQSIIPYEQTVLHRILDLSETTAEEMMRPRGRYVVWKPPVPLRSIVGKLKQTEYIFIQDQEAESIRAAVALNTLSVLPDQNLEQLATPVIYVPWCALASEVLQAMQEQLSSVAVVVSEYGETVGVLTEEDILDSVFAREPSRARRLLKREPVLHVGEGVWHIEGLTTLRHLAGKLGLEFDPDEDDSVTVGGLLQGELERFPREGDECEWRGYRFRVIDAPGRGQLRAVVQLAAAGPAPATVPRRRSDD
ncbi:MAG: CNNM domain-containing protein [Planctomycetaceae bacterium]